MINSTISPRADAHNAQRKFWRQHILAWQGSGLSQRVYCRQNNLKEYRFSHWKIRLAQAEGGSCFVPVPLEASFPVVIRRNALSVFAPNGFRVDVSDDFDELVLKKLLATVQGV